MIKVTAGRFKGQALKAPSGKGTRPTSQSRREALYNILYNGMGLDPKRCLDLFAGTGSLGFEALSRGAHSCVFIESGREALKCLKINTERLSLSSSEVQVIASERYHEWGKLLSKLTGQSSFDLVLCDPPYEKELASKSILALEKHPHLFSGQAVLVLELGKKEEIPSFSLWTFIKERKHGEGRLCLYMRVDQSQSTG